MCQVIGSHYSAAWRAVCQRTGFILVYRLAMDAKTREGDDVGGCKYPSLLEDFQTGTVSMDRKRHLASSARGFLCFCLMAHQRTSLKNRYEQDKNRINFPILRRTAFNVVESRLHSA